MKVDMSPQAITQRLRIMDDLWLLSMKLMDSRKVGDAKSRIVSRSKNMTDWRELVEKGLFAEAEPLMLAETKETETLGPDAETRAQFFEDWGDRLVPDAMALEKYRESHYYWAMFASWSTSGGEGTARMIDVTRVLEKIEALKK